MITSLFAFMAYLSPGVSHRAPPLGSGAWSRLARLGGPLWRSPSSSPRPVDRRFNRARYDAHQEADRFAGRLRNDLDLDGLRPTGLAS